MPVQFTLSQERRLDRRAWAVLFFLEAWPLSGAGIPPEREEDGPATPGAEALHSFSEPFEGVNWDEVAPPFIEAIERVFERNGWMEEPDRFALEVARKVAVIPPWDVAGRLNKFTDLIAQRYGLPPEEATRFQASIARETAKLLLRHGPAMFAQGREAIQDRVNGTPYTAEQVARWSKDAESIFRDAAEGVERLSAELEASLDEPKKELFRKDLERYRMRQDVVERMTKRWAAGEWDPSQWGMEDDPIQMGKKQDREQSATPAGGPVIPRPKPAPPLPEPVREVVIPSRWIEHDPTTWIALVLEFRDRYGLDAGQMTTAWSIHGELVERAAAYAKGRGEALAEIPIGERATHEAYRPIREQFGELHDRLEALPTSTQRDSARPSE